MDSHRAAIRLDSIEPVSVIRGTIPLHLGRLESDLPNFRIEILLNVGRIGLPAAELRFQLPALAGGSITELRMAFEPGVHAPSAPGANRYNVQQFSASFQGRPGGAGNMNRNDHPDLRDERDVAKKKRTLKIKLTTHGFVPYPDTFAMDAILTDARTPTAVCDFIRMLRDATAASMIWYCVFDAGLPQRVITETLQPFQDVFNQRQPPLFQYEPTRRVLTLDMTKHKDFGDKMYTTADRGVQGGFTGTRHQLPDMQGRTTIETVARTHIIGHIREYHGQEDLNQTYCNASQDMRLVRSRYEILRTAPGACTRPGNAMAIPKDSHVYVGYINTTSVVTQDYNAPPAGTRFQVSWQSKTTESAYGIVLDLSPSTLKNTNSAFVMALFRVPPQVKARAATQLAEAKIEKVKMVGVQNRLTAQTRLDALHRFASMNVHPTIISLRHLSVYRRNINKISTRDIRGNAATWNRALVETKAHQLQNQALSPGANNMLTQLVQHVDRHIELLEMPLKGSRIDACLALAWQFLALDGPVILVSDFTESRAELSFRLWDMHHLARQAPEFGRRWAIKKLLAYTCSAMSHDSNSPAAIQTRCAIDLSSRYLDDLPSHEWACDESGSLGQTVNVIRQSGVPPAMSMGSAIFNMLASSPDHTLQARRQYFLDRQQDIDNTRPASADVASILQRRTDLEVKILRSADVLITDSATAGSEKVRNAKQNAVLIYMDTQAVPFSTAAATIACYPTAREVFVCGNSADDRYPLRWFARNHNEARDATAHGAWNTFLRAGNVPHRLA